MEYILSVQVRARVDSFRRPLDHNYQRTFPMPPPTTLIGIAAAALELSNRQSRASERYSRRLKVSVLTDNEARSARQMWTVLKIKGKNIAEVFITFGRYFPTPLRPCFTAAMKTSSIVWSKPSVILLIHCLWGERTN